MRILVVYNHFYPEVGAMRTIYELSLTLKRFGHDITVLTTFPRPYKIPKSIDIKQYNTKSFFLVMSHKGLKIFRVKSFLAPYENFLLRGLDSFFGIFSLLIGGLLQFKKFDVILCGGDMELLACIPAYLLKKLKHLPCVLILDDIFPKNLVDSGVLKNKLLIKIFEMLEKLLYRNVDVIVVHSQGNKKMVIARGAEASKVRVVPLWADIEFINSILSKNIKTVTSKFNNKFVVSFAGVISYAQDLDTVVEAAKILEKYKKIVFLIVGEGPNKTELVKKVTKYHLKNVFFFPMQSKERYIKLLQGSSVSLVPLKKKYTQPVVPSKLIEIMSVGRPVIISAPINGDAPKLVKNVNCGIVVPPGNPEKLASAILYLYENSNMSKKLGQNGYVYVRKNLSLTSCAKKYEQILEYMVKKYNNSRGAH